MASRSFQAQGEQRSEIAKCHVEKTYTLRARDEIQKQYYSRLYSQVDLYK